MALSVDLKESSLRPKGDNYRHAFMESLNLIISKERVWPQTAHQLEILNIIYLSLIEHLEDVGFFLEADIFLMELLANNSFANGYTHPNTRKKIIFRLLDWFTKTRKLDLIQELENELKKNNIYKTIISDDKSVNSDTAYLLNYLTKNGYYELAKNIFNQSKFEELSNSSHKAWVFAEAAFAKRDIGQLEKIEEFSKEANIPINSATLSLAKEYTNLLNGKKFNQQDIHYINNLANRSFSEMDSIVDHYLYDSLQDDQRKIITDVTKNASGLFHMILFEINVHNNNYLEALRNLEKLAEYVDITSYAQSGISISNRSIYFELIKERLFYNFNIIQKRIKSKHLLDIQAATLKILSIIDKPSGEIELNINILSKRSGNTELLMNVKTYLYLIKHREDQIKRLFKGLLKDSKYLDFNQNLPDEIYRNQDDLDYNDFFYSEKLIVRSIRNIRRIDKNFFKNAFRHNFELSKMQKVMNNNQSFQLYAIPQNT